MVGRFHSADPCYWDFPSDWVPILWIITNWLTHSFWRKNQFVSIEFSSSDLNLVQFFNKIYYLTVCKHFISILSLIFNQIDSLFHWFSIFLIPHFYKTLNAIGSIVFYHMVNPGYQIFGEVLSDSIGLFADSKHTWKLLFCCRMVTWVASSFKHVRRKSQICWLRSGQRLSHWWMRLTSMIASCVVSLVDMMAMSMRTCWNGPRNHLSTKQR